MIAFILLRSWLWISKKKVNRGQPGATRWFDQRQGKIGVVSCDALLSVCAQERPTPDTYTQTRYCKNSYLRWQVPEELQCRPTELSHGSRTPHFSPFCLPQVKQQSSGSGSLTRPYPAGQNSVRLAQSSFSSESESELPPTSAHFFTSQDNAPWKIILRNLLSLFYILIIFVLYSVATGNQFWVNRLSTHTHTVRLDYLLLYSLNWAVRYILRQ